MKDYREICFKAFTADCANRIYLQVEINSGVRNGSYFMTYFCLLSRNTVSGVRQRPLIST